MLTVNSRQRFEEGALLDSSFIRNFKCVHKDSIYINGQSTSAYVPPFACKFNQSALCGNLLGLVDEDGSVSLIDTRQPASDSLIKSWTAHKNAIFDIEWVGENQLVTASGDMHMILWDTSNQTPIEVFTGHTSSIKSINVHSSNQNLIVSGSRDGSIMMWDTRVNPRGGSQRPVNAVYGAHTKPSHSSTKHAKVNMGGVTSVLFHQDHFIASVGASDGFVKLWDTRSTYLHLKQTPPPCFHSFASPGCHGFTSLISDTYQTTLYASCMNNVIYAYNSATLKKIPIKLFTGHKNSSFYVRSALSTSGRFLISGSSCGSAFVWDTQNPQDPPTLLTGHYKEVTSVAWAPNQLDKVVTCSDAADMKIWRADMANNHDERITGYSQSYDQSEYTRKLLLLSLSFETKVLQEVDNIIMSPQLQRTSTTLKRKSPINNTKSLNNSKNKRKKLAKKINDSKPQRTLYHYMTK